MVEIPMVHCPHCSDMAYICSEEIYRDDCYRISIKCPSCGAMESKNVSKKELVEYMGDGRKMLHGPALLLYKG